MCAFKKMFYSFICLLIHFLSEEVSKISSSRKISLKNYSFKKNELKKYFNKYLRVKMPRILSGLICG